ncbi:hypothetical protein J2T55_000270 [Methylohalomonas lacus]|uniref:DUF4174 domain-containing protein n=1 Tax=Methylohalomonas lacus TaxID=398773 RepID=A0AAE3L0D0_9GAMM|nr:DUF4174 domain-containing protein [Methylohalomonas lacus]MCS3902274.1 hypothetical protein [Methylohalomonas lacus]
MKKLIASLLLLFIALPAAAEFGLEQFKDQQRPLLVFSPDNKHAAYQETTRAVAARQEGFDRRDMVLLSVFRNTGSADDYYLSSADANQLRDRYDIADEEFRLLLIGKDGGIKFESNEAANLDELFELIDAMPMRQREMRQSR